MSFGPFNIKASEQVFVSTPLSMGLVNLKPVVPGAPFRRRPARHEPTLLPTPAPNPLDAGPARGGRQATCW